MRSELREELHIRPKAKMRIRKGEGLTIDLFKTAGSLNLKSVSRFMTQKQKQAFLLACMQGHCSNPQETALRGISRIIGLH